MPTVLAALVACGVTLTLTPIVRRWAMGCGLVDLPGPRKIHRQPTPYAGSVAVVIALATAGALFLRPWDRALLATMIGALWLWVIGWLDDLDRIHHQVKFLIGMPLAGLLLVVAGVQVRVFPTPALNISLTLLWVIGITAAVSIVDNMDGLASSVVAVAAGWFVVWAWREGLQPHATLAAAVMGACAGFLPFNWHPARMFLGNAGALVLGFLLAALGLLVPTASAGTLGAWLVPVGILAVPVADTTVVTISRLRRGLIPFMTPGRDHLSHRLLRRGLSQRQVALLLAACGALAGGLSVWWDR